MPNHQHLDVRVPSTAKKPLQMNLLTLSLLLFFFIFVPASCVMVTDLYGPQNDNATKFYQMQKDLQRMEQSIEEIKTRQGHLRRVIYITTGIQLPEDLTNTDIDQLLSDYIQEQASDQ